MRQSQILGLARMVALPVVVCGLFLTGCDSKPPSEKDRVVLTAADKKAAFEKKLATFRLKAEAGDPIAQLEMGRAHERGTPWAVDNNPGEFVDPFDSNALKGLLINLDQAADWYEKAAMQGNAEAQYLLGMLWLPSSIDEFLGTPLQRPRDAAKAATWFEKAAKQKHVEAAYQLARLYAQGNGVAQNNVIAFQNYLIAAEQGDAQAQFDIGLMSYQGNAPIPWISVEGGFGYDFKKAEALQTFVVDYVRAADWWRKAAAQGHAGAQNQLAHLYFEGKGVPKDPLQANEWWQKAADRGDGEAQNNLGISYLAGVSLPKDTSKAFEWFLKSAMQGEQAGQSNLAKRYGAGDGVDKDQILAYAWFNLAAANPQGNEYLTNDSKKWRTYFEESLSPAEVSEAQRISSSWKVGQVLTRQSPNASGGIKSTGKLEKTGTGTVFVVSKAGQAITNQHVVNGCTELRIEGREGVAKLMTEDKVNDLALIQIPGKVNATATIAGKPEALRQGEDIIVFGFPLNAVLSSGGNLTPGVVSALTGLGNNTNQLQITAPIQPGSSGSPMLNKKGEVVGVVNMKLSDSKMARATGEIGQNVNFAISGQTLKAFLDKHKAGYKDGAGFFTWGKDAADLAEEARKWTLVVECWK